MKVDST